MNKTFFTCLAIVGIALPAAAQTVETREVQRIAERARQRVHVAYVARDQRARETATEKLQKTVKIGTDGELVIVNISGDITVTRGSGSNATLDIVKTARANSQEEAKQMLGLVQVDVTERAGRVEVATRYPNQDESSQRRNHRNVNVSVDYTISTPVGTRLTVKSISGDVKVSDIKGDVTVNVVSGDISVANAAKIGSIKAVSGDVEILDGQLDGVDADTVSGDIMLRNVRATRVGIGSVSGNVVLSDVQCERAEAHTMSGDVEFDSPLSKNGRYEFKSHSGGVRVSVGGATGFELEANSFTGSFRSDLQMTVEGGQMNVRGPGRRPVRGVYGDGSAVLNITTFSGSIVIAKK